jgi:translation initiation factor 1
MGRKQKLDFTPGGAALNNPFAELALDGLPAGAATPLAPAKETPGNPRLGRVVLRREKAHRGGKTVIVVDDFAPHIGRAYIEELAGRLKAACGCGGTAKERRIEIQGDQPARIRALLEAEGFRVAGIT